MQRTVRKKHGGVFSVRMLAAALSLALADRARAQCMYEVVAEVKNPTCTQGSGNATVTAINDLNVAVGYYAHNCGFDMRPIMWSQETGAVPIPLPPGAIEAEPRDINNNGEIVGRILYSGLNAYRAFRYKDGVWTELSPTGTGIHSEAFGINDDGWACGYQDTSEGRKAFRWRGDVVEELASPVGGGAVAMDVNEAASSTGIFGSFVSGLGFLWERGRTLEIPPLRGGTSSEGRGINNDDSVTGQSRIEVKSGSVPRRSWSFKNGELTDLGSLPEADHRTIANDINDALQIVGRSEGVANGTARPFLWQHEQIHDLESLIVNPPPNNNLSTANAINNNGWIALDGVILRPIERPLGDINIDCVVDERDLVAVLEGWGPDRLGHIADIVTSSNFQPPGDGKVNGADLAVVLGNWSFSTEASAPKRSR